MRIKTDIKDSKKDFSPTPPIIESTPPIKEPTMPVTKQEQYRQIMGYLKEFSKIRERTIYNIGTQKMEGEKVLYKDALV